MSADDFTAKERGSAERRFARLTSISGRETLVLQALANGYSTDEAAAELHLSPHTVRTYVKTGMRKLGARTRTHAVAIALTQKLIVPPRRVTSGERAGPGPRRRCSD